MLARRSGNGIIDVDPSHVDPSHGWTGSDDDPVGFSKVFSLGNNLLELISASDSKRGLVESSGLLPRII